MNKQCFFWQAAIVAAIFFSICSSCRYSVLDSSKSDATNTNASPLPDQKTEQRGADAGDLKFQYQERKKDGPDTTDHTVGGNPEAIEKLISELNQRLSLPFDMIVSLEDCETPDAYYEPENHHIAICHQLIDSFYFLFEKKIKDKAKLDRAVKGATAATFFHEVGHGLIDAWKIPTTGREEDAVDQLSTLVLIEATEDGEQMALEGALSFKLYADFEKGEKIYWDEHSLDEQRFFDTICLVYGHDEEKYGYLVKDGTLPEERAQFCSEDYRKVSDSWRKLLAPYLKQEAKPPRKLNLR